MDNKNNFPKIKPVKLKEEQKTNESNQNQKEKVKEKDNIKPKNKISLNILSCYGYLFFFLLFISIFALNYYYTENAFNDNKTVILPADKLCQKVIKIMANCLKEKNFPKCQTENRNMEICYEQVHTFNQKCYIIISELELCYRKNKFIKNRNKCENIEKDLILCGSSYRYFFIKEFKIKDLFTLK